MTDLLVIGAGPAGLTAALYARRAGLSVILFDGVLYGGQMAVTPAVENYPGVPAVSGPELAMRMMEQAAGLGAVVRYERVEEVSLHGAVKSVTTASGREEGRSLLFANGARRRKLGVPGEERLTGRGVSYCAACDGALYRGKKTAVVGGGNTALEDALYLSNLCAGVVLIHRRTAFRGEPHLVRAVREKRNIELLSPFAVESLEGAERLEAALLRGNGEERRLELDGLFVAIGYEPDNALAGGLLPVDDTGYLAVGEDCLTPIPGVFAAGDCRSKPLRQIVTAAADGAVAAFQAAKYLNAGMGEGTALS
ncbi:MAG TPA: FAD-dependent oxidoreductase [Firmicutes bacterium]|nr:FAD-dependent oxidoreductase [Bacillota bacterium]